MFKYRPEDVDCRYCTDYSRKHGCRSAHCPYLSERIEAGVVGYGEAVAETFKAVPAIRYRLAYLTSTFPGTMWSDGGHERRMNAVSYYAGHNRKRDTNEYFAALYLLSADRDLYRRTMSCHNRSTIRFEKAHRRGISTRGYTLLGAAKTIYLGTNDLTPEDLTNTEIIDTDTFRLIINALLIVRYGVNALEITQGRSHKWDDG